MTPTVAGPGEVKLSSGTTRLYLGLQFKLLPSYSDSFGGIGFLCGLAIFINRDCRVEKVMILGISTDSALLGLCV